MGKLNVKQRLFAHEYLIDLNGAQAAIRAGYSESRAKQTAHDLLQRPEVAGLIDRMKSQRVDRTQVNADSVLNDLMEYRQADLRELFDDLGALKPIHEWPEFFTRLGVVSIKSQELFEKIGKKRVLIGYVKEVKWENKTKVLELIGKHIAVNAWRETKKLEVDDPLLELYRELNGQRLEPKPTGVSGTDSPGPAEDDAPAAFRPKED